MTIVDRLHGRAHRGRRRCQLRRSDGTPAYNLVVVVDDAAQRVEEVVGDLLSSTPRHAHLADMLGILHDMAHVPLVLATDGDHPNATGRSPSMIASPSATPRVVWSPACPLLGFEVPDEETHKPTADRFAANQMRLPVDPHPQTPLVTSPTVRPTPLTPRFVALVSGVTSTSLAST